MMIRWVAAWVAAFFLMPILAAQAAAPLPKPKPRPNADPQAAIQKLFNEQSALSSNVAAYAAAGQTALQRQPLSEAALYIVGKLSEDGGPIGDGIVWRVFRDFPDGTGALPLVHKGRGGDLEVRLEPGRYIVHASYGRAALSRTVNVMGPTTSDTFVLNAGGLQLDAIIDGSGGGTPRAAASFEIHMVEGGAKRMIGTVNRGVIARLPAGNYHIVSRYGALNAVRSADVIVEAGKLTRVSMRHQAGHVQLKLARTADGEAIANTEFTVYTDDGRAVFERVGAHANLTLAAGSYAVVARHNDYEFSEKFEVTSGDEHRVTVLAQRLSSAQ
ncbi:MAG: hypothetical protein AAF615_07390 [Pseudomonadota bacterium]